jgi:ATP-dependent 26S proteasome regulatory subunit
LELESIKEKTKENQEKIKLNKQLPYLVGNIVEVCFSPQLVDAVDGSSFYLGLFGLSIDLVQFCCWDFHDFTLVCTH